MFFHLIQNTNPQETKSFANFVAQLSLDNSQKGFQKYSIIPQVNSGTDFVNVRVKRVTIDNHENLHDKI